MAEFAANAGASVLREAAGQGHSAAAIAGLTYAQSHGAVRALTLPADAPLVTAAELRSLIESAEATAGPHLTLVPSHDGDGTNGFLVSPPDLLQPAFGPGSFARHVAHAAARNIECHVQHLPGLALDVDEPRDLARLMEQKQGCARYDFLSKPHFEMASELDPR